MCIGVLKRVCHWGPLIALGIIKAVTLATVACLSQWWPPDQSYTGALQFFTFCSCACLTLYYLLQAMYTGPGYVPANWQPEKSSDIEYLQYCQTCETFKAPRAHHCRKCQRCILKMDHHCPWINNCVGHRNHTSFTLFLLYAVLGCSQSTIIITATIYRAIYRSPYGYATSQVPVVYMTLWSVVVCMFVLGLAIGVVLAVGMLLVLQCRGIMRNRTGIEDWILEKAVHRRKENEQLEPFLYPYDLGRWKNFTQVINFWCEPVGNGLTWAVRDNCDQYTLTVEQLAQKAEKRLRARVYLITRPYSGYWLPCTHGIRVCMAPPCTDERRIALEHSDVVSVTRWKRNWLYGEVIGGRVSPRYRGWFPRHCATEVVELVDEEGKQTDRQAKGSNKAKVRSSVGCKKIN